MSAGQVLLVVVVGVVAASALCWFAVAVAVRRTRREADPRLGGRAPRAGGPPRV